MSTRKTSPNGTWLPPDAEDDASDLDARPAHDLTWLVGDREPDILYFEPGDLLQHEGASVADQPALLVGEGELEERMSVYTPGLGIVEQPVFFAREGDFVNLQAMVSPYDEQSALVSVHALTSGYAYVVPVESLAPAAAFLTSLFRKNTEALERERQLQALYGSVAALFQNAPDTLPFVPADPHQLMQRLVEALEERGYLAGRSSDRAPPASLGGRARILESENRTLEEKIERTERALKSARSKASELEKRCDFEQRARAALEQRVGELLQHVAEPQQGDKPLSTRFPSAICILESNELEGLETDARRHRELAQEFESRARKLHRAIELLEHDNPAMIIGDDVMMLMLGEEPPPRLPETTTRNTIPMLLDPKKPPPAPRPVRPADTSAPVSCPTPSDGPASSHHTEAPGSRPRKP